MSITLDKEAGKNVENIDKELEDHKSRAIVAYDCMKSAKKAKKDDKWIFICMDLQQTMQCPKLSVGSA